MPQRDIFHDVVKSALIKDGWTITHDLFILPFGVHNLYIDLGAERTIIAAEKTGRKIAVEIKSFIGRSEVDDLENALGQYILYRSLLQRREPERTLYLAVPMSAYNRFLLFFLINLFFLKEKVGRYFQHTTWARSC